MADKLSESLSSDHVKLKIPSGDSPYVKAKHVQLVEKDPNRAVVLFWRAINSADRVDSALKDMAVVMKQLNRAEEAIEAIKSFRGLCSTKAQEPLDNVLLDLYKKCGRVTEQIDLLNHKLRMIDEGIAFGGRIMKTARSQGKKFHVTVEQEKSRLLGNLAWAYMQCENYKEAEPLYRRALEIENDINKMCNLAICLMQTGRLAEAKIILADVKKPTNYCNGESYQKSFERAWEIMNELELIPDQKTVKSNSSVSSTPCSFSDEKASTAPLDFDMASLDHEVSPDALSQGSIWGSSSQEASLSPVSVKVTSQSKPMMISEYSVERKKIDSGTENMLIRLDIQIHRPKSKEFVVDSKKVMTLDSNDQSFDKLKAFTDEFQTEEDGEGAKISFEIPDLSSGPNVESLFYKTEKKTWADMVEEDEQLAFENAEISSSSLKFAGRSWADIAEEEERSDNKNFEFGSCGRNQKSATRTPISSFKKLNRNETQKLTHDNMNSSKLKTACHKYRSGGCKELSGRWRGTAKNAEQERRSLSSDPWPGCNLEGGKLGPEVAGSGGKCYDDSDYLSGMGGRYSCRKQRNRLQVFQEITIGDAKA
ncbi:hypothetical protein M5K25_012280 [Dendrobium thyrsiflorum]|uniref:Uncharacterized protein n=1 Tax=Dendrobium thyrsiflorum TaxID=117978 RepID=A0ABD0V3Y3_DENTH